MTTHGRLVAIYRSDNSATMLRLVKQTRDVGIVPLLWALDRATDALGSWTVGEGPGPKFDLLNNLLEPGDHSGIVIVADDDVRFATKGVARLLNIVDRARLDLAQPAHSRRSHATHQITRRVASSRVRLTTFVEIGPLFVVSERAAPRLLPFPEGLGMGWGLEARWAREARQGIRLAIVDQIPMRHLFPPYVRYDTTAEMDQLEGQLKAIGADSIDELHVELDRWSWWQREPPWIAR
jgi:hypothetical protein